MAVMTFDAGRRGRLISQQELAEYSRLLATAVTEALHYFIGHDDPSPRSPARYLAVTGAHITHMLRDTFEDVAAGYFNIPREFVEAHGIDPRDVNSDAYRAWVESRVRLARDCFKAGRDYLSQVKNLRCRMAGYAYTARFEGVLDAIEREGCWLRPDYRERKSLRAALKMGWSMLTGSLGIAGVQQPGVS
jgi:phytoene/squalene synthetase